MDEQEKTEEKQAAVSRRDFLRRAGKEAVTTGARIVPGAALAKVVLDSGRKNDQRPSENGEQPSSIVAPERKRWWEDLVLWKADRKGKG